MGKGESKAASAAAASQADVAQQTLDVGKGLLAESAPARQTSMQYYTDIAKGTGPNLQRAVAPQINAASQQYYTAGRSVQNLAPGGQRDRATRDLALGQASTKSSIYSGGVNEAIARLASMGMGGSQMGVGAYGSAGQGFGGASQNYAQLAQMKSSMWSGLAGGFGSLAGSFI
jgi:hypothetical protein